MPITVDTKHGRFMVLPNDSLGKTLMRDNDYEPHFYEFARSVIKPGDHCIDCGANLGYHAITLAKITGPTGIVLAIEPQRIIFQQLNGNVFLNDLRNVLTMKGVVGDEVKTVEMNPVPIDEPAGVNIGAASIGGGGESVQMMRLDDMVTDDVSFIKIDVQGYEMHTLRGGEKMLENSRPVMFFEIENPSLVSVGESGEKLINYILSKDYIVGRIHTDYPCDHFAIPREKKYLLEKVASSMSYKYDIIDGKSVKLNFDRDGWQNEINYGTFEVQK